MKASPVICQQLVPCWSPLPSGQLCKVLWAWTCLPHRPKFIPLPMTEKGAGRTPHCSICYCNSFHVIREMSQHTCDSRVFPRSVSPPPCSNLLRKWWNQSLVHLAEAYMGLEVITAICLKSLLGLLLLLFLLLPNPTQGNTAAAAQSCEYCFQWVCFCRVKNYSLPIPLANCLFARIKVNI